jgi:hypothetical protein
MGAPPPSSHPHPRMPERGHGVGIGPLPAALRLCDRLYLRGGTRGGLLSGLVEEVFTSVMSGVRPTPRMVSAWAARSVDNHGPSSSSLSNSSSDYYSLLSPFSSSSSSLTVTWSFASHEEEASSSSSSTTTTNSVNRLRVIGPHEGDRILAALAPGWIGEGEEEGGLGGGDGGGGGAFPSSFSSSLSASAAASLPGGGGGGGGVRASLSVSSPSLLLPLSVVWRPPPALAPYVTPEHIRVRVRESCVWIHNN